MNVLQNVALTVAIVATVALVAGLFIPWIMLWWMDIQNRRRIFKLYGSIAAVSYFVYWLATIL